MHAKALLLSALPLVAQACLRITGQGSQGVETQVTLQARDNGVLTCEATGSGEGSANCIPNFKMSYDWQDNPTYDPLPVTYCNAVRCYDLQVPANCTSTRGGACCNGAGDCTCNQCDWNLAIFECQEAPIDLPLGQSQEHDTGSGQGEP